MKQILNWTLGGFFRSFGRILCYLAIGGIIAFLFAVNSDKIDPKVLGFKILGIEYVKAATIQPSSATYMSLWCEDDTCPYTESGSTDHSSWLNVNSSYQNPAGHIPGYYLEQLKFRFQFSQANYLTLGNTYVISVKFNLNPRIDNGLGLQYWGKILDLTYSDNTSEQFTGYSATCSIVNNDNYAMVCSFAIQPTKAVKDFTFRINFPFEVGSIWNGIEGVNYKQYAIMTASDTTEAINQQTNELILNSNQNTQEIINSLNDMAEKQKEDQQVCTFIDKNNVGLNNKYLNSIGEFVDSPSYLVTNFISLDSKSTFTLLNSSSSSGTYYCFYNINKELIRCYSSNTSWPNNIISIPNDTSYFRASISISLNIPTFKICKNGNQAINDTLNDTDTSSDSNDAIDFFNDFELEGENTLLDLLFLPLDLIEDLSNQEFSDLCFTLKGKQACFPSGSILWNRNHNQSWFGNNTITINMFKTFFNLVVGGYLAYRLLMAIVNTYRRILDPVADATKVMKL